MASVVRRLSLLSIPVALVGALYLASPTWAPEGAAKVGGMATVTAPSPQGALTRWLFEGDEARAQREATERIPGELEAWRSLYETQRPLDAAETEALKRARQEAAQRVVASVAGGGADGAALALAGLRGDGGAREKLLLIEGLGANPSAEAVGALEAAYKEQGIRRMREDALRALGRSEAPGRAELLQAVMMEEADGQLSQVAAMGLFADADSMGLLVSAVYSARPMNTRLEALHSLAGIGVGAAGSLAQMAADPALGPRVQAYAKRELARLSG